MDKKWIFIAFGVVALAVVVTVVIIIVRKKKDNEAGIIDWISSKTE